ncbi:4,5-DOPA dioxygenase extradiol [Roseivirga sp. BDSF3-8]|uniref:4,5-DOPA-extradiol-dioxygenase n=1 Tax=Roseivirga sp. BDSF3-8 TaxID=3241598 RepID=UPI00353200DA
MSSLSKLAALTSTNKPTERMPVLFLGHGSPLNGIEENEFVQGFRTQGKQLNRPAAIVVVSAHWETKGTRVTAMKSPRTIHDFGGFPRELYEVRYPAPGNPALAKEISRLVKPEHTVLPDDKWGLDHGSWTVVKHLYPDADVPVIQLSLDYSLSPRQHYALARQLKSLRDKGVLIIGSGNLVHNLDMVEWRRLNEPYAYDWAIEANEKIKGYVLDGDHDSLINFNKQGKAFDLAIPTPEHYLPVLYSLALKDTNEEVMLFNDQPLGGSLSMTSLKIG